MSTPKYGYWEVNIEKQGRLKLPSGLVKGLPEEERSELWITHGFGKHVMLWTTGAFREKMEELNQLNSNDLDSKKYRNAFLRNLTRVDIDGQDRFVIPKPLIERYNLKKNIVLIQANRQIEVWDYDEYYDKFSMSPEEFSALNEKIFGSHPASSGHPANPDE